MDKQPKQPQRPRPKALERPQQPQRPQTQNKALERPEEWHRQQRLRVYEEMRIKCYTVYTCDPLDRRDEYNNHFPRTREGLKLANDLISRGGYGLHEDEIHAHECMPYICIIEPTQFQAWCKAWNVKL